MAGETRGVIALVLVVALAAVAAGLAVYKLSLEKARPALEALSPEKCGEYTYLARPDKIALYYVADRVDYYHGGGITIKYNLGSAIVYVARADCKNATFTMVQDAGLQPQITQVSVELNPFSYPYLVPDDALLLGEPGSAASLRGGIWTSTLIEARSDRDPFYNAFKYLELRKYDPGTGILLENSYVFENPGGLPEGIPDYMIYSLRAANIFFLTTNNTGQIEVVSIEDTINYGIASSMIAGTLIVVGILSLLHIAASTGED